MIVRRAPPRDRGTNSKLAEAAFVPRPCRMFWAIYNPGHAID